MLLTYLGDRSIYSGVLGMPIAGIIILMAVVIAVEYALLKYFQNQVSLTNIDSQSLKTDNNNETAPQSTAQHIASVDTDSIYANIATEIESGNIEKGLWTRAFAECNGDENRTKAAYIKEKAERLITAEKSRLEKQALERAAAEEKLAKLRPPFGEYQEMQEYGIKFDGKYYIYGEHKCDRLANAVYYAKQSRHR